MIGKHRDDAPTYTEADLDAMVANFQRFRGRLDPPVVIGHEESQPLSWGLRGLAENTGNPAVGWVTDLWRVGPKLYADVDAIHPRIAELIRARAYRKVSAEVYDRDDDSHGLPATGCVFRRLALLGGELPQVKDLADFPVPEPSAFSAAPQGHDGACSCHLRRYAERRLPGGTYEVFFEVQPMDRTQLEDQLRQLGYTDEMLAALEKLPDEDFQKFVTMLLAKEAGIPTAPSPEGEPTALAEWPEGMDRQAVLDWLVAQGEDPAALEALSDDDLLALYQQKQAAPTQMSEPPDPNPEPEPEPEPLDEPEEDEPVPESVTPPPAARRPAPAPAPAPTPRQITKTVKFSEADRRALVADLRRELARETAAFKAEAERERRARRRRATEEKRARIRTFCETMVKEGKVSPAEMDETNPRLPSLVERLMLLPADTVVRKYTENGKTVALTPLDIEMRAIEARPPRRFSEKVRDGEGGGSMDPAARKKFLNYTATGRAVLARQAGKN